MSGSTLISVRVSDNVAQRLAELADATDRSKSYLAAQALEEFIALQEWQVKAIRQGIRQADAGKLVEHKEALQGLGQVGKAWILDGPLWRWTTLRKLENTSPGKNPPPRSAWPDACVRRWNTCPITPILVAVRLRATRELVVTGTPFIVIYRVRLDTVQILARAHHARKWPAT